MLSSGYGRMRYTNGWSDATITASELVLVRDRAVVIGKMAPEHGEMLAAYRARAAARRTLEGALAGEA